MLAFGSLFYSTKSIVLLLKILGGIEIDYIYTQPTDLLCSSTYTLKLYIPSTTNTEKQFSRQGLQAEQIGNRLIFK